MSYNWTPLLLSFQLALITTLILLVIALPLAYWLAHTKIKGKFLLEAIISLPLVLPPTVLGFYLLILLSPNSGLGAFLEQYLGLNFIFSFEGLVLGSVIYSLPFMVQPIQAGFEKLPYSYKEAAQTMGKSEWQILTKIYIPNSKQNLLTGVVLAFAHTLGEFGIVLMLGGKIPNETRVASIAIYDEVEALNYGAAHFYAFVLLAVSFCILAGTYFLKSK